MRVELSPKPAATADGALRCVGLFAGDELPGDLREAAGAEDVRADEKSLSVLRPEAGRAVVVGLGEREGFDPERARVAAALAVRQARRLSATAIAWDCPPGRSVPAALTAGTVMAAYRFTRLKSEAGDDEDEAEVESLTLHGASDPEFAAATVPVARAAAEAANRARDLQNLPANICDPAFLADRAREIAATDERLEVQVLDGAAIAAEGLGGLAAVSAGSAKDPALITLRYRGAEPDAEGPTLGLVGKGVTFDSGGISIKPSAGMELMKKDMSGAAAVLEATAAIAELALAIDLIAVVPAVENMPSGSATRPGDVITQLNGRTVEVNNTDAEGRLILADALTWAIRAGADHLVDIATLTGAVVVALGSSYAGLVANDDGWAERVAGAGEIVGELAWRLPLHPEYKELMRGTTADLTNSAPKRKAGTLTAASFLEEFVEGVTWAHLDIAGTSWDVGREYLGKSATGFGTRLLVELARQLALEPS